MNKPCGKVNRPLILSNPFDNTFPKKLELKHRAAGTILIVYPTDSKEEPKKIEIANLYSMKYTVYLSREKEIVVRIIPKEKQIRIENLLGQVPTPVQ